MLSRLHTLVDTAAHALAVWRAANDDSDDDDKDEDVARRQKPEKKRKKPGVDVR